MIKSESIANLSEALAKAQGIMEGAKKDCNNPYFRSKYADLASVWEACRKPLSDNGLSVIQVFDETDKGVIVETILSHSSGEYIGGRQFIPIKEYISKDGKLIGIDAQTIGSACTYARRYGLQSIVGIAPEDDDGNDASHNDSKFDASKINGYKKNSYPNKNTSNGFKKIDKEDKKSEEKNLELITIAEHYIDKVSVCNTEEETRDVMKEAWPSLLKFKDQDNYDLISHKFKNAYDKRNSDIKNIKQEI